MSTEQFPDWPTQTAFEYLVDNAPHLNAFYGYRAKKDQRNVVVREAERIGLKQIGHGRDAVAVRRKGSQWIIKIFIATSEAGKATMDYLRMAKRSGNPLFPRIHEISRVGNIGLVLMEVLASAWAWTSAHAVAEDLLRISRKRKADRLTIVTSELSPRTREAIARKQVCLRGMRMLLSRVEALREIHKRTRWDLNRGNIMVRRGAWGWQMVVTDPIA